MSLKHVAEFVGDLFGGVDKPAKAPVCTRENYARRCGQQWSRGALLDALENWRIFEERRAELVDWLKLYRTNRALMRDVHTLRDLAWRIADTVAVREGGRGSLGPLLDFEERYQRAFLRRGLLIYLELLREEQGF